jgi:hypothetical protein
MAQSIYNLLVFLSFGVWKSWIGLGRRGMGGKIPSHHHHRQENFSNLNFRVRVKPGWFRKGNYTSNAMENKLFEGSR